MRYESLLISFSGDCFKNERCFFVLWIFDVWTMSSREKQSERWVKYKSHTTNFHLQINEGHRAAQKSFNNIVGKDLEHCRWLSHSTRLNNTPLLTVAWVYCSSSTSPRPHHLVHITSSTFPCPHHLVPFPLVHITSSTSPRPLHLVHYPSSTSPRPLPPRFYFKLYLLESVSCVLLCVGGLYKCVYYWCV